MIYTYAECLARWESDYQIKKQIASGKLFRLEKGFYGDQPDIPEMAVIARKYPKAIFTLNSAFYVLGLSDTPPEKYHIATDKHSFYLCDKRIRQYYVGSDILNTGVIMMNLRDTAIRIYDRERMLIELIRYKSKLPHDYYKKILGKYRKLVDELDMKRIFQYAAIFPRHKLILRTLESEVL
ncbi:MAG: hypothetical protein IKR59_09820 [Lachnospiraceae bacterium]|nr:hypothetical protein [Lachnospiraceae bacterium]